MNQSLILLVKVQLQNQLKLNAFKEKSSKNKKHSVLMLSSFAIIGLVLLIYSFLLGYGLGSIGFAHIIPAYALTITALLNLFFTFIKTNGVLFGFRDYDLLMSLPISTRTLISSRFITMYLMNTLLSVVFMLPMAITYFMFEKLAFLSIFIWICGILLAALIPTTLACIAGALLIAVSSRLKHSKLISVILTFLLFIVVMAFSIIGSSYGEKMTSTDVSQLGEYLYQNFCSLYPPTALFSSAITEQSIVSFLLFAALSIGWYALFLIILARFYKAINTNINGHITKHNYKMTVQKKSSPLFALYKKEWKTFVNTPIYITNIGMGVFMTFALSIAFIFLSPADMEKMMQLPDFSNLFLKIAPFICAGLLGMSCSTSSALSLEGKNLWIIKSSPVSVKTVFDSKILLNLSLLLPVSLLFSLIVSIRNHTTLFTTFILFLIPIVFSFFTSVFGMYLNCSMPNYEWESETAVVKQSLPSMLGILGCPLIIFGCAFLLFEFNTIDYRILCLGISLVIGVITLLLYRKILKTAL